MKLGPLYVLLFGIGPAACSFSLDVVGGQSSLSPTTSDACRSAFLAPIDCEETLLQLASSGLFMFSERDPLELTCTDTCKAALDKYVHNVKGACTAPGDRALLKDKAVGVPQPPVEVVGEIFRYIFAWGCAKDEKCINVHEDNSKKWCYKKYGYGHPYYAKSDFPCTAVCPIKAMEAAHEYPGSDFLFKTHKLSMQSPWWRNLYADGWKTVLKCRGEGLSSTDDSRAQVAIGSSSVDTRRS
ncbi:unnamed protein product [Clonostachys chloroleuca]|uniref:Uncharacterized protein n=1 Tax=Clonostachys chloroleuca TaxID=1926264 RepID=A0AA35MIZ5_9HYPO|nr:unnamed protein product [Clonostachys chloroleuca]